MTTRPRRRALSEDLRDLFGRIRKLEGVKGVGVGGHVIEDEGVPLPTRGILDFVGDGVTATDDAGNDKTIVTIPGGGGGWDAEIVKQSDESVASTTAFQDDDELFFTTGAGVPYQIEIIVIYASPIGGGTPDIKLDLGEDNAVRGAVEMFGVGPTNVSQLLTARTNLTDSGAYGTAVENRVLTLIGTHVGGTNVFKLRWTQNTSNINPTIVRAGSLLRYRTIV